MAVDDFVTTFVISGLFSDTLYTIDICLDKSCDLVLDQLNVKTSPMPGQKGVFSALFTSCFTTRALHTQGLGWKYVAEAEGDYLMFLGDFIYTDYPLYVGGSKSVIESHYRNALQIDNVKKALRRPTIFMCIESPYNKTYNSG